MTADVTIIKKLPSLPPLKEEAPFLIPTFLYKNIEGSFGIMTRDAAAKVTHINWEGCRDRFQTASNSDNVMDFLFYHNDGAADNVISFIKTVEEVISKRSKVPLKDTDRLHIQKTNNKNVLYVKMSSWWKYRLRRSLLTALLRCGQFYIERTPKYFELALFSQYYTAETKPAVTEFLHGRTGSKLKKKDHVDGWYQFFAGKQKDGVRKTLCRILPKVTAPVEAAPVE
jgi:hypothetical protein